MTIKEIILRIKEGNLSREQLEEYYDSLTVLYAEMNYRMGEVTKEEALFLADCKEKTKTGADRLWLITPLGQEQITLKYNIRALEKLVASVKHRIYKLI